MATAPRPYLAYMLRLWQEKGQGETARRGMLESPHTSERHGFASLEVLLEFLKQHTEQSARGSQTQVKAGLELHGPPKD